jgi:hypothetical protein
MRKKLGGWFSPRSYLHFDFPLSFQQAKAFVSDPEKVAQRAFLPFLSFIDKRRRFRTDNSDRSVPKRLRPRIMTLKEREIMYASHGDAAILSFYAHTLQQQYEIVLRAESLQDEIVAYRSGLGNNADIAADAFQEIMSRKHCTTLCIDIRNFFPSIDHRNLKSQLQAVLSVPQLEPDWYAIYRMMTKYCHVRIDDVYKVFSIDPRHLTFPLVSNVGVAMNQLRAAGVVRTNGLMKGIPQGAPISAVFANISMLEFDKCISRWVAQNGGYYRRYSDDILIICDEEHRSCAVDFIRDCLLTTTGGLQINDEKTEVSAFTSTRGPCMSCDRPLNYLGFEFDGSRVLIRASSLSRFYRRMTYATRATRRGAKNAGADSDAAHKRNVYRMFSHLGRRNFYSYATRSEKIIVGSMSSGIRRQMRRHFRILTRKLDRHGK